MLIATPDHWHALPMIAAVRGGRRRLRAEADQRRRRRGPGDAGRGAQAQARRAGRHAAAQHAALIEGPRPRHSSEGKLGKIGHVEICCYYHMRADDNPPDTAPPAESRLRNVDRTGADAALQPAGASAQLAGVHGIRQRHRRRHVRAHARHGPLDAGPRLAERHQLRGRHPRRQGEQGEHHRHADGDVRLRRSARSSGSTAPGATRPIRSIRGAPLSTATRARSRRASWATTSCPSGKGGQPVHNDVTYEFEQFPEDKTEKDLETHVAPAIRAPHEGLPGLHRIAQEARRRHRAGLHLDDGCILANLSMQLGRSLTWDHARGMVVNDEEANKLLRRPYRAPWVHPDPAKV